LGSRPNGEVLLRPIPNPYHNPSTSHP
jgi:hypothetical protein